MRNATFLASLLVPLLLTACSTTPRSPAPALRAASAAPVPRAAPAPPSASLAAGGAFAQRDVPLRTVLARSRASGRPAMLLFRTDWCGYCQKLERETLPDARVRTEASRYTAVAYDADRGEGKSLAARYGVRGFPTLVLVDASGNKLDDWAGYNEPEIFAAILRQMRTGS